MMGLQLYMYSGSWLDEKLQCKWKLDWRESNSNAITERGFHVTPPICCTRLGFGKNAFWATYAVLADRQKQQQQTNKPRISWF